MDNESLYHIMHEQHAELLRAANPHAPLYDGKFILSGTFPHGFTGEIVELYEQGFNANNDAEQTGLTTTQLVTIIDQMRSEEPTGRLLILSEPQGKWLYRNHPSFMPKEPAEII